MSEVTDHFVRTTNNRGTVDHHCYSLAEAMEYARLLEAKGKQPILYVKTIAFIPVEHGFTRVEKLDLEQDSNGKRLEPV